MKTQLSNISKMLMVFMLGFSLMTAARADNKPDQKKTEEAMVTLITSHLASQGIHHVKVSIANNEITLEGEVPTIYRRMEVQKMAHNIGENYNIINHLTIENTNLTPEQTAAAIQRRIRKHVFYSIFDWVTIEVGDSGIVTLNGWVSTPWHKAWFVNQAERVAGVKQVRNDIKNAMASAQVQSIAARIIYDDPRFEQYSYYAYPPIHIISNGAQLILEGYVTSERDKSWISQMLEFNSSIPQIVNNLMVVKEIPGEK